MKTIVLANASVKEGNRGCVALCYCAIYIIDKVLGRGNYRLFLTDSQEVDGKHELLIGDSIIGYESITIPRTNSLRGLLRGIVFFKSSLHGLRVVKKADFVLDIGQGDSFADIYGDNRFNYIDYIHKLALYFRIPFIILPQTIGPFNDAKNQSKAVESLEKAALVMARDKASFDFVKQVCQKQVDIHEYIDVAFVLPYKKIELEKEYTHIGLNLSALLWNGGYTNNNQFGLACDYKKLNKSIIDYFLLQPNTKVHLISHVVLQERNVENDYEICYELWREYSNPKLVLSPFPLSPIDVKSYIAGLDFFMGARMHSTIAAFSAGVPVVPLAYSRKFNGLFVETLSYPHIVDMKSMNEEDSLATIKNIYNNRYAIRSSILYANNNVVKKRCESMVNDLREAFAVCY